MTTTSTLEQLVREIIPALGTTWVDNYEAKRDWINRAQKALEAALEQPPATEAPVAITTRWPDAPKRCNCPDGFLPNGDDSFICGRCGGNFF